ncbi:hypothetical protein ACKWTF_001351 [Chironomus riparius]
MKRERYGSREKKEKSINVCLLLGATSTLFSVFFETEILIRNSLNVMRKICYLTNIVLSVQSRHIIVTLSYIENCENLRENVTFCEKSPRRRLGNDKILFLKLCL